MIYIDLPADLNLEDDHERNIARLADAIDPCTIHPGAVVVAGSPGGWSWAIIDEIEDGFVYFRQVSAREASDRGPLVTPLPRPA
jgi:hypothetical protein